MAIDILLNNAGYGLHGDFLEMPIERTVDMIQLNITALTELTYLFGRDMAKRGSGHILLIASLLAFQAVPSYAAYAATKAYVLALGEALHDELRPHGVAVTSLCPGHTATGFDAAAGATASPWLRLLTMKPRPVAASGIRPSLKRKGHGGRGPVEQDGRPFKSSDAAINAKGHDEKNNGGLVLWRPLMSDRQIMQIMELFSKDGWDICTKFNSAKRPPLPVLRARRRAVSKEMHAGC